MTTLLSVLILLLVVVGCATAPPSDYPTMFSEGPWLCRVDNGQLIQFVPYQGTPETIAYRGNLYCKHTEAKP